MLKIDWGLHDDTIIFVDEEFDGTGHSMEWFRDPFVQEMIRDIDNCIYDSNTEICIDVNNTPLIEVGACKSLID